MKSKLLQWLAITFILEIGLIHILNAQAEYDEAAYMGYLFAANFFASLLAALGIYRRQAWGWYLGLAIAAASIAGYTWSRTLGMPGMNVEEWFAPYGVAAMTLDGAFVILALLRPWKINGEEMSLSALHFLLPASAFALVAVIAVVVFRWDSQVPQVYGLHVGTFEQVSETPPTSTLDLVDKYGVQVSLAATSMMDSIVDVRLLIVDPDKAHTLLQNQTALYVDRQELILAPHMHSHILTRLPAGKVFVLFFPTRQVVRMGSSVSLVFGSVRTEPMTVQ